MEKKEFKRLFPHITEEIETEASKINLSEIDESGKSKASTRKTNRRYAHYQPTASDFIRRCRTPQQAEEIIGFLKKKGEITEEEAEKLLTQLREKGLRSFGPTKKPGFYEK